ncbi:MAG: type I methionyl aminopeptidase [Planctomycetota bacterium]|jgi:methionyl aminopeptidase
MAINLKSRREIDLMRQAGSIVADVLLQLKEIAQPGMSTAELNEVALKMTEEADALALFKGVKSPYAKMLFPGAICTSLNEQVVHGIPSESVKLKQGDLLSIDFGIKLNGYCADSAVTFGIGKISALRRKLIDVTEESLRIAISEVRPAVKWSSVASKMQSYVEAAEFSVVTEFVGHGIGREMHEEPKVPNFVSAELLKEDIVLEEGMVLAIEPMINIGTAATKTLKDGWTVVTKDGRSSAHFEHTIAITKDGCEVLTVK